MDPSLREIIAQAVAEARKGGLDAMGQRGAAVTLLAMMMPSLDMGTVRLIVEQLYPYIADLGGAA
jgi:hypothetical protein